MLELIKKHLDSFVASDWNAYKALLTSDTVYEEAATRTRGVGAEQLVEGMKRWKAAFPDLKFTIKEIFVSEDRCVVELDWAGTHKGTLEGPMGAIPATGKYGTVPAVLIYRFRDNKIVETHHYFDMLTILSQLGLVPGVRPGAAPQPQPQPQPQPRH